jgi:hypothetical protein
MDLKASGDLNGNSRASQYKFLKQLMLSSEISLRKQTPKQRNSRSNCVCIRARNQFLRINPRLGGPKSKALSHVGHSCVLKRARKRFRN